MLSYLSCQGATSGYADGTFRPFKSTTRSQLAEMVVLGERWQLSESLAATFGDVQVGSPFFSYVETAYEHGIISGYSDGTLLPGANITRGPLCEVIVQA